MSPADKTAAKPVAAGSERSDQQLGAILENLERVRDQGNSMEQNDLRPGFTSSLDQEASERKAIHDRLVAIESEMKRRGSRGFTRYLVAVLIGVAATWLGNLTAMQASR